MQKKNEMFAEYPDVVDVEQLREMLGGISRKLAYRLLASGELRCVRIGRSCAASALGGATASPSSASSNT